jgi:hypothetical protein
MRVRMSKLRMDTTSPPTQETSYEHEGGRGKDGSGRGGGGKPMREHKAPPEKTYKSNISTTTNQISEEYKKATSTSDPTTITQETSVTISDITEPTIETNTDMEEEDEGLSDIMSSGIVFKNSFRISSGLETSKRTYQGADTE